MNENELKHSIESSIRAFLSGSISQNALNLFAKLGYKTDRQNPFIEKSYHFFKESFLEPDTSFNEAKARVDNWKSIDLLFQLTQEELSDQQTLFDTKRVDNTIIETYLFFAIELNKTDYSRSALAQITREINKIFPMPVMLLFKYGDHLTLSVINRRLHKKDEQKDVLEKVTLIKDISTRNPHRAHIEILFDLSFDELKRLHKFTNFVELHNAWQKTLDTKELNKRFYRELSNWYFWAINCVSFPNDIDNDKDDTVFNSESIIRLLTRLIFIWFIKEKNLIPDKIFEGKEVSKLIRGFNTKDSTVYYRAVLQNLFFATLNQKIEERAFATDGTFEQNKKNYGIKNLYRYSSDFAISKDEVIKLFERVPFLNGGLFDCLDSEDKNGKVMYLDGFSRNPKKQAQVPDELFFSQEKTIDLSAVYDNKRKKNETVKGLFVIFNHYKFTITENTPIEEEVALDPELLGRVFENLLASYNPETKTTARKQTGSFYTPREIVNYMVDESLKAYLKQKLETEAGMKTEDAEVGLEFLLGYNEKEHLFNEGQTSVLINAIDNCKILDPACGSGAFPMGILHKLVHILHKLDPQNKLWEERQIEKAMAIDDPEIRDTLIADIETAFNNNELDYGRKLYLIENCIYGVDIQPIASQISKLRFFISLIVDQKADKTKDNFGIRPLPNLETKFVAANTLIGIDKPKAQGSLFDNQKVKELEEKLKDVRHRLFSAKTPATKRKLREEDQKLREEMGKILEGSGWSNESARQLAAWDPYNQNASSSFFDPAWMFGITDGFDVLIGNPPYIFTRDADFSEDFKRHITKKYFALLAQREIKSRANQSGKINLFALFILRGIFDSHENGTLCYIVPNNLLRTTTYDLVRKYLLENSKVEEIVDLGSGVFDNVTASTIIFRISKSKINKNHRSRISTNIINLEKSEFNKSEILQSQFLKNESYTINIFSDSNIESIISQLNQSHKYLKDDFEICAGGIATGPDKTKSISNRKINAKYKPLIEGKDVKAFFINYRGLFIEYDRKKLYRAREEFIFLLPEKLVTQRIGGGKNPLVVAYDDKQFYTFNSTNTIYSKANSKTQIKYLLAILNSQLLNWFYSTQFSNKSNLTVNISKTFLDKIPIANTLRENEDIVVFIVNYILLLKKNILNKYSIFFERLIDAMVYELYFPEEIKAADAEVLKYLINLPELKDDWSNEKKLEVIEKVCKELSDPKHPVSITMEKQKTVPEVRIIEGLPTLSEVEGDK